MLVCQYVYTWYSSVEVYTHSSYCNSVHTVFTQRKKLLHNEGYGYQHKWQTWHKVCQIFKTTSLATPLTLARTTHESVR